nr:UDP-glycosyltransferase [Paris polyphylla]
MDAGNGRRRSGHVLLLPFPAQGHINPLLQFGKRLASHGAATTIAITRFFRKTSKPAETVGPVALAAISDGFDEGGFNAADSARSYLDRLELAGSETLAELIESEKAEGRPVDVLVYDAFLPWALDVAKQHGVASAVFFTQSCAVDLVFFHASKGRVALPTMEAVSLPGLPWLDLRDLPSFLTDPLPGPYPAYRDVLLGQFKNIDGADFVLMSTFSELEHQAVEWMRSLWPIKTIGPTVPSSYLDNRLCDDTHYGFHFFDPDTGRCMSWLDSKLPNSVIYVSFGSFSSVCEEQMTEVAAALTKAGNHFLWVVRSSEMSKLPDGFVRDLSEIGLVVSWSPQLEVLAHEAVGCFVTHCGWNSTLEGLSLGVPMVAVPLWTDQPTNAKFVADVWGVGVRAVTDEHGIIGREEMARCVKAVMDGGERSEQMRMNARKWKEAAKVAVNAGGSSDRNIVEFVKKFCS